VEDKVFAQNNMVSTGALGRLQNRVHLILILERKLPNQKLDL
jgi:hypothetical protein